jgi:hypothetical protein
LRTGYDPKDLRRCCLLLQGFGEASGALAEVLGPLPQFVEQPRVLDGDNGLRGKVLDQLDLLFGELPHYIAIDRDCSNHRAFLNHRNAKQAPNSTKFYRSNAHGVAHSISWFSRHILDLNELLRFHNAPKT